MFGRNIDFFAVLFSALALLGLAQVHSWSAAEALDSVRAEDAIQVERCPVTRQVLAHISSALH